jgi:hypothetical protein
MTLNILKLCVGTTDMQDLADWQEMRLRSVGSIYHTTRMIPKRADEIVGKGSLYWVIRGMVSCRQKIISIDAFEDTDGITRCNLVLDQELVPVRPQPRRPFQGWRYLKQEDAPQDLSKEAINADMPERMRNELAELGLL